MVKKFTPTNLTNIKLFESVYPFGGCYLEKLGSRAYICSAEKIITAHFYYQKGNNELGVFLDCLYHMGTTNPSKLLTSGLAYVFFIAKQHLLNGYFRKGDDIPSIVKKFKFDENTSANDTTFEQQCFIFTYLLDVSYEQPVIV
ncbi:MAG: hypothetical protein EOM59_16475 [Clostridia bacterium]|nr:hypothetical protein [Clostridia bacterium]